MDDAGEALTPPWERTGKSRPAVKQLVLVVATAIFERVATGLYPFGTRLPTEREMSREFGVARNTMRQVLEFLEDCDVVTRRPRSGMFVSFNVRKDREAARAGMLDIKAMAEEISPFDMNVIQSIVEPEIVRLATISMSVRDLAGLRRILSDMDRIAADADRFADLERRFMTALSYGTRNSAVVGIYRVIDEIRAQPHWSAGKRRSLTPGRIQGAKAALHALFTAIQRREADMAVECIRFYIAAAQEDMIYAAS